MLIKIIKTMNGFDYFPLLIRKKREYLSVKGIAIDPNDDIVYFICGSAYFTSYKAIIYKTKDGGKTFKEIELANLIQVNRTRLGREYTETIK